MIRIALHGANGHQIHNVLAAHPGVRLTALSAFPRESLPATLRDDRTIREHPSLDSLLADPGVDFVSLCSPRRAGQAADAIRALRAGKHVLAEKPCAMNEEELDAIIAAARATGRVFHEMAGTAFEQPYFAMREIVRSARLGEIVQVVAEKSYPYFDARPQDEAADGGLVMQNAIHALRFVEHVAGAPIASVSAVETTLGNPVAGGGLRMAASLALTLRNGGIASIAANYLNPRGTGVWGDESLRILGTRGIVESRGGGAFTRLVIGETDHGPLDTSGPGAPFLRAVFASISTGAPPPFTIDEELSPIRWAIRAKQSAVQRQRR
ncbi:MAG: Gfo/Idh/MocA family oxidoreductase [Opitutaceae bacterium]|jgi:predicted dehydrogenase|nr:Gfo/Idh/MocA family oxidoreductase [Opitutaceae bacterium]